MRQSLVCVALLVALGASAATQQAAAPAARLCLPQPLAAGSPPPKAPATIAQVAWIGGVWSAPVSTSITEERWTPPVGGSMLGVARFMRNDTLRSFEFLCIVERGGTLVYQAMPNGRSPATDFTATAVAADSITFENPAHDFPKVIRYSRKADGSLETTVAGEGGAKPQTVILKRQE